MTLCQTEFRSKFHKDLLSVSPSTDYLPRWVYVGVHTVSQTERINKRKLWMRGENINFPLSIMTLYSNILLLSILSFLILFPSDYIEMWTLKLHFLLLRSTLNFILMDGYSMHWTPLSNNNCCYLLMTSCATKKGSSEWDNANLFHKHVEHVLVSSQG